jgi:hypothetical protein
MGTGSPGGDVCGHARIGHEFVARRLGGFDHAATLVEQQVVNWLGAMLGFPAPST